MEPAQSQWQGFFRTVNPSALFAVSARVSDVGSSFLKRSFPPPSVTPEWTPLGKVGRLRNGFLGTQCNYQSCGFQRLQWRAPRTNC